MKTLTLTAILGFALAVNAGADTLTFDSINTSTAPFQLDITTTNYLAQYGITLVNNSPGTTVDVLCANADYNTSCTEGQGAIFAHSGPNVLKQSGNGAESYTLQFSNPLSSLSFYTAGYYGLAPNGLLVAQWSVTAYDGATAVNSVGQPMTGYFVNVAPEQWTLTGPGITSATFSFNCFQRCGEGLIIDDLSSPDLVETTPEPATLWLLATGLLALCGAVIRRRRTNPITTGELQ